MKRFPPFTQPNGGNTMRNISKLAQVTAIGLACAFERGQTAATTSTQGGSL